MKNVHCIVHKDKFEISDYSRKVLKQAVHDNEDQPLRAEISIITPESKGQRKYLMGGLMPLLVYLDGNDYRNNDILDFYFEHYKKEFAPEVITIHGKAEVRGKSTKGSKALNSFIEKIQDYLDENYGISHDSKATNPEFYKEFRDTIYPFNMEYKDFIDYLVKLKIIK